jgi:mono/diheme cytochrome c family protein
MPAAPFLPTLIAAAGLLGLATGGVAEEAGSDQGEELFAELCSECHQLHGHGLDPGQQDLSYFPTDQREHFEQVVRRGQGMMPAVGRDLAEEEMEALWGYFAEVVAALN